MWRRARHQCLAVGYDIITATLKRPINTNTRSIVRNISCTNKSRLCALRKRRFSSEPAKDDLIIKEYATHLAELSPESAQAFVKGLDEASRNKIQALYKAQTDVPNVPEPSFADLKALALHTAIPFVGFGIMDNAILIVAGDAIDTSLGVVLGISTMCAAAIGNIISDVAGIMLGTVVEDFCAKYLRLRIPILSHAQRQLRSVRLANQFGCAVGIVIGCIIGMFPLLFIDSNKIQALKREASMNAIFKDVINEAGSLIGAQRMCLFLIVNKGTAAPVPSPSGNYLYAKYNDAGDQNNQLIPLGRGIISRAALTGESWNVYDVRTEPDYMPEITQRDKDDHIVNMLCVPILDNRGRSIAVIQAINKNQDNVDNATSKPQTQHGFTAHDVQILKALASHISVALQRVNEGNDAELGLKDTIQMLKEYGLGAISEENARHGRQKLFPE